MVCCRGTNLFCIYLLYNMCTERAAQGEHFVPKVDKGCPWHLAV